MQMARWAKLGVPPNPGSFNEQREIDLYTIQVVWGELARCQADQCE
jgi:hypothetical protein